LPPPGGRSQTIAGEPAVWSFGQDDPDHSSALVLLLPQRDITLIMLANTDELSNPFRLMMGDISESPFAVAFLEVFAAALGASLQRCQTARRIHQNPDRAPLARFFTRQ